VHTPIWRGICLLSTPLASE